MSERNVSRRERSNDNRSTGAVGLVAVLLLASCSLASCSQASTPVAEDASPVLDEEEIHRRGQEAIANCMLEFGFRYEPEPYLVGDPNWVKTNLFGEPDRSVGYGGTARALTRFYANANMADFKDPEEGQAYDIALLGGSFDDEDAPAVPTGGCQRVGADTIKELRADPDLDRLSQMDRRLVASSLYFDYAEQWYACVQEHGYEPMASDPVEHTIAVSSDYHDKMGALAPSLAESGFFDKLAQLPSHIDGAWLDQAAALDPAVAELIAQERALAAPDMACRAELNDLAVQAYDAAAQTS